MHFSYTLTYIYTYKLSVVTLLGGSQFCSFISCSLTTLANIWFSVSFLNRHSASFRTNVYLFISSYCTRFPVFWCSFSMFPRSGADFPLAPQLEPWVHSALPCHSASGYEFMLLHSGFCIS